MTVAAYTPASGYKAYPPYINARIDGDAVVVTVRGEEDLTGEHPQCGVTASMRVPLASFTEAMALLLPVAPVAPAGSDDCCPLCSGDCAGANPPVLDCPLAARAQPPGGEAVALNLRPKVLAFAVLMEAKLRENDWKGGWQKDSAAGLMKRLREEAEELAGAVAGPWTGNISWKRLTANEAADVANFAMMVADVCGGLPDAICDGLAHPTEPAARDGGEARFAACYENGAHPDCHRCYRGEVPNMSDDSGLWVEMGAVAGGANEHGLRGRVELIEHHPDGRTVRREYVATDSPARAAGGEK